MEIKGWRVIEFTPAPRLVLDPVEQKLWAHRSGEFTWRVEGDVFANGIPLEWVANIFGAMELARREQFLVLTENATRMHAILTMWRTGGVWRSPRNVTVGVTCRSKADVAARVPVLIDTPARSKIVECLNGCELLPWMWGSVSVIGATAPTSTEARAP